MAKDGDMDADEAGKGRTSPPTLAGGAPQGERRGGLRAVGVAASRLAAPIVRARGGGILARLKAEWPAIVGSDWAVVAWPATLGGDRALKLRVAPAAALALQHQAPLLVERINLFFGRGAVSRLVLVQGALPLRPPPARPARRPLATAEAARLEAHVAPVVDPELREALARLGRAVLGTVD